MEDSGYRLLRGVLTPSTIGAFKACIQGDFMDYARMSTLIAKELLEPHGYSAFTKFRVSDNNNSADAGTFHRDVVCPFDDVQFPGVTVLTYLDATTMELIPGSHKAPRNSLRDFTKRECICIMPGDVLIFYSTLLHRGIFTEELPHRRLIQVFDVFTTAEELSTWNAVTVHVPGDERASDTVILLSRFRLPAAILNVFGFLNAVGGYGDAAQFLEEKYPWAVAFSSEGLRDRISIQPGTWQPINKYAVVTKTRDIHPADYAQWKWILYYKQFALYLTMLFLILFLLTVRPGKVR